MKYNNKSIVQFEHLKELRESFKMQLEKSEFSLQNTRINKKSIH